MLKKDQGQGWVNGKREPRQALCLMNSVNKAAREERATHNDPASEDNIGKSLKILYEAPM